MKRTDFVITAAWLFLSLIGLAAALLVAITR
jgi:hypothetical protein